MKKKIFALLTAVLLLAVNVSIVFAAPPKALHIAARSPRRSRCTRHLRTLPLLLVAGDGEALAPLATASV